jgi:hypothetical protein
MTADGSANTFRMSSAVIDRRYNLEVAIHVLHASSRRCPSGGASRKRIRN